MQLMENKRYISNSVHIYKSMQKKLGSSLMKE